MDFSVDICFILFFVGFVKHFLCFKGWLWLGWPWSPCYAPVACFTFIISKTPGQFYTRCQIIAKTWHSWFPSSSVVLRFCTSTIVSSV